MTRSTVDVPDFGMGVAREMIIDSRVRKNVKMFVLSPKDVVSKL